MTGIVFDDAQGPDDLRIYAIGDIHGRFDLLQALHRKIDADRAQHPLQDWRILYLGDLVDRGPQSADVIGSIDARIKQDARHIALAGNHDLSFLTFLASGQPDGVVTQHGGRETALSYGVRIDFDDPEQIARGHAALLKAVPQAHIAFLENMPRAQIFGDFFFCHAGVRPQVPLDRQDPDDLIWIRQTFLDWTEPYSKVVVHGHTPVENVDIRENRVNLDTHAWKSSRLSAIVINGTEKRFLEASLSA